METCEVQCEMPKYQCHKQVRALKIKSMEEPLSSGGCMFWPENTRYAPILLSAEYMEKHQPKKGGYYVVYLDGYQSWSPAEAFESGYTLIS